MISRPGGGLAIASPTQPTQRDGNPFELQRQAPWGVVAVASRPLAAGVNVLVESPVITAQHSAGSNRSSEQLAAFEALPAADRARCISRFFAPAKQLDSAYRAAHQFVAHCKAGSTSLKDLARAALIWRLNSHTLGPEATGLLEIGCIFSHDCRPNISAWPICDGAALGFWTHRSVQKGEQLTASYLGLSTLLGVAERRALLARDYLFECQCSRCVEEAAQMTDQQQLELHGEVARMVTERDLHANDPVDARALVELELRCVELCGANHWTSKLTSLFLAEATISLLRCGASADLLRLLRIRLTVLAQWLVAEQQAGYFLGEFVDEGVRLARGTKEESQWGGLVRMIACPARGAVAGDAAAIGRLQCDLDKIRREDVWLDGWSTKKRPRGEGIA